MVEVGNRISAELESLSVIDSSFRTQSSDIATSPIAPNNINQRKIAARLSEISSRLSHRYLQVCVDVNDRSRFSWTASAHDLRDILATVLRTLAPDEEVVDQNWFVQDPSTRGPTQSQRARFICSQNRTDAEPRVLSDRIELINELVGQIARATYTAGSKMAHTHAELKDCVNLLMHFDALMFDLLDAYDASGETPSTKELAKVLGHSNRKIQ